MVQKLDAEFSRNSLTGSASGTKGGGMACSDKPQALIKRTNGTFLVEPVKQDAWANLEQDQIIPKPINQ